MWPRQNFSLQYQYNFNQISDENKEKYQFGDNYTIQYQIIRTNIICKNCMVDSKENYKFDLGVEGLTHLCECFPGQSGVTLNGIAEIIL